MLCIKQLLASVLLLGLACSAFAQRIENIRASFADGKVTVLYDITGGHPRQTYSIRLLGSHNQFSSPLRQVTGDVGDGVSGGKDRKIIWDAESELVTYSGGITFRISGSLIPMKLTVISPEAGSSLRRGKEVLIRWEGGLPDANVKMELYRGNTRVAAVGETRNTGVYTLKLPKDLEKGEYAIHFAAGGERAVSAAFTVKPGFPKGILVGLGAAAVGLAVWMLLPDSGSGDEKLPVAPDPQ